MPYGPQPGALPPTRLISFQQIVMASDPAWQQERLRPVIYKFSNGRDFVNVPEPYWGADGTWDQTGWESSDWTP